MEYISLSEAFAHVAQSASYWVWLIIALAILGAVCLVCVRKYKDGELDGSQVAKYVLLALIAFTFALLFRPVEVANNTTKEQAARGVYIGY